MLPGRCEPLIFESGMLADGLAVGRTVAIRHSLSSRFARGGLPSMPRRRPRARRTGPSRAPARACNSRTGVRRWSSIDWSRAARVLAGSSRRTTLLARRIFIAGAGPIGRRRSRTHGRTWRRARTSWPNSRVKRLEVRAGHGAGDSDLAAANAGELFLEGARALAFDGTWKRLPTGPPTKAAPTSGTRSRATAGASKAADRSS